MGTSMAPSYANLFMDRFERSFLAQEPILPLVWKRYIDDILCIWTGTRSELDSFLDRLNKAHRTPRSVFKGLVKGEAIRFLRSNTDEHTFYSIIHKFRDHLLLRNYPQDFVDRILHNITYDLRASYSPSLKPSPSPASDSIVPRLITAHSPYYTSLPALVRKHWSLIQNDPSLSTLFPTPPQLCFRKNATFADSLVKASLLGSSRPTPGQVPPIPIN